MKTHKIYFANGLHLQLGCGGVLFLLLNLLLYFRNTWALGESKEEEGAGGGSPVEQPGKTERGNT